MASVRTELTAVRVEDESSIGRSYSKKAQFKEGLGAERRALKTKSFNPHPHDDDEVTLRSLSGAFAHLSKATREDVQAYFDNTWQLTDTLFSAFVNDSVFYQIPDKLRRPLIFYFAHPAALYVNKMHLAGLCDNVDLYLQKLFETGVDEMSWDDMDAMQDENFVWPTVEEAQAFRSRVKEVVDDVIRKMPTPAERPVTMDSPYWTLFMGFEHERIHIETSSVLIRQLPIDMVAAPRGWTDCEARAARPEDAPRNELVATQEEVVVLGKPRDFPSFGWDNEYGKRVVTVPAFRASKFLCSNAEFLPFVLDGGYESRRWWVSPTGDDEGWRWRTFRNATHPSFWVATSAMPRFHGGRPDFPYQKDDGHARAGEGTEFRLRTEFDIIAMPWDWPVEVNYLEARAFLNWKSAQEGGHTRYRVPTEAEYHVCRGDPSVYPEATIGRRGIAGRTDIAGLTLLPSTTASSAASSATTLTTTPTGGEEDEERKTSDEVAGGAGRPSSSTSSGASSVRAGVVDEAGRVDVIMQPDPLLANTNLHFHSPTPVNFFPPSSTGFHDTHGNVWQWVEDHFAGLPGFEIHYLYDDFSTPCFDGWHTMILGGSWVSTGDQSSNFARYSFRRHFFQHLGFRYVAVDEPEAYPGAATVANLWEGHGTLSRQITDSFTTLDEKLPGALRTATLPAASDFNAQLANLVADHYRRALAKAAEDSALADGTAAGTGAASGGGSPTVTVTPSPALDPELAAAVAAVAGSVVVPEEARAATAVALAPMESARVLHLGCGAGGATFELCRHFGSVTGLDNQEPLIRAARLLQHHGEREYERVTEGVLTTSTLAHVPAGVRRERALFVLGDAMKLGSMTTELTASGAFDVVVVDSLLARLTQPLDLLRVLAGVVKQQGLLVVASSNDWNPADTPRNSWLGGFKMNGEDMTTRHMLNYTLKRSFHFVGAHDVPKLTTHHARRVTLDLVEVSVFQRRK